jgi:hypothetical protein
MRHPETTMLGPDKRVCREDTVGLLSRRKLEVATIYSTGKGINALEERRIGLRLAESEHRNTYVHPDLVEEQTELVRETLRKLGDTAQVISRKTGISARTIERFREGKQINDKHLTLLVTYVRGRARAVLSRKGINNLELGRLGTVALLQTLLRHGERICAIEECDKLALPRSPYCSKRHQNQANYQKRKEAARLNGV